MPNKQLTQDRLKELFHYCEESGVFTRLIRTNGRFDVGSIAGSIDIKGYLVISVDFKKYKAHRLAWLYVNGSFPTNQIDHINHKKTDNRIANLRIATQSENNQNRRLAKNNTSGHAGVVWDMRRNKWKAQIQVEGKYIGLGHFSDLSNAVAARSDAKQKLHKFQPFET